MFRFPDIWGILLFHVWLPNPYSGEINGVYIAARFFTIHIGHADLFLYEIKGHWQDNTGWDLIYCAGELMGGISEFTRL